MKTSSGKGILHCKHCGLELTDERDEFGHYRHSPIKREGYFYCDYMMEIVGKPEIYRNLRGTPIPSETIIDKLLDKYK